MVVQSSMPGCGTAQFLYRLVWPFNREQCLLFMDAAISEIALRDGAVCDLLIRNGEDDEQVSLNEGLALYRNVFEAVGDKEFQFIAIVLEDHQTNIQLYVELSVDSEICDVQLAVFNDSGDIDTEAEAIEYAPDLFLDAVEILTHVSYTTQQIETQDLAEEVM